MVLTASGKRVEDSLIAFFVLATVTVALRMFVRIRRNRSLNASDYAILFSWVVFVAYTAIVLELLQSPAGTVNIGDMSFATIKESQPKLFASEICSPFVATAAQLSLLLYFHSIFPSPQFRKCNYVVMSIVVSWLIAIALLGAFRCKPVIAVWDLTSVLRGAKCIDLGVITNAYESGNIIIDVMIGALPVLQLRKLNMGTAKVIGTAFVYAVGVLIIATSAVRLYYANNQYVTFFILKIIDATQTYTWDNIRLGASIICASLPPMSPILDSLDKHSGGLSSASNDPERLHSGHAKAESFEETTETTK